MRKLNFYHRRIHFVSESEKSFTQSQSIIYSHNIKIETTPKNPKLLVLWSRYIDRIGPCAWIFHRHIRQWRARLGDKCSRSFWHINKKQFVPYWDSLAAATAPCHHHIFQQVIDVENGINGIAIKSGSVTMTTNTHIYLVPIQRCRATLKEMVAHNAICFLFQRVTSSFASWALDVPRNARSASNTTFRYWIFCQHNFLALFWFHPVWRFSFAALRTSHRCRRRSTLNVAKANGKRLKDDKWRNPFFQSLIHNFGTNTHTDITFFCFATMRRSQPPPHP